jgi:hypothetical protein
MKKLIKVSKDYSKFNSQTLFLLKIIKKKRDYQFIIVNNKILNKNKKNMILNDD